MIEEEFNRYTQFQISQQSSPSSSTATFVQTGDSTTYLSSSSTRWVIDSSTTDHMIGDSSILSSFRSSCSHSSVALADGSSVHIKGCICITLVSTYPYPLFYTCLNFP